jgi:hypothetical protein
MLGTNGSKAVNAIFAKAIRARRKFNASEAESVMAELEKLRATNPEYTPEISEAYSRLGNRSACAKDLAKGGLVTEGSKDVPAWVLEVQAADKILENEETSKAAKEFEGTKKTK